MPVPTKPAVLDASCGHVAHYSAERAHAEETRLREGGATGRLNTWKCPVCSLIAGRTVHHVGHRTRGQAARGPAAAEGRRRAFTNEAPRRQPRRRSHDHDDRAWKKYRTAA